MMGDAIFFLKFAARQVVKGLLSQYKYGVRFELAHEGATIPCSPSA
jgi:hypothetical protein